MSKDNKIFVSRDIRWLSLMVILFFLENHTVSQNFFSIKQDIRLGKQINDEIKSNPDEFPLLDKSHYPEAYRHLNRIKETVLNSGEVRYKDEFDWEVTIIGDTILNAFATPGGYIYVYTGLIRYLDTEVQFAGVLAHEIAHADRRHSTKQLTKAFGLQLIMSIALGQNQNILTDIAANLVGLSFSRGAEKEADKYSVKYLCPTIYKADGGAGFFEKLQKEGGDRIPAFLSTHPSPNNRIDNFHRLKQKLNCTGNEENGEYEAFKSSLPQT